MTVALKQEIEPNQDPPPVLSALVPQPAPGSAPATPPVPAPVPPPETPEQKSHRLEIENAELRGKTSVLEKPPEQKPAEPVSMPRPEHEIQWEKTKVIVSGHITSMSDEDFESHYKVNKTTAQGQIVSGDQQIANEKSAEETAKMRAENKLYAKYGPEYAEVSDEMDRVLFDASTEVRKDPKRLGDYLERHFKTIRKPKKETPTPPPTGDPMQRRITNFDTPNPIPAPPANPGVPKETPVDPSIAHITKAFGINSEEEREQYSGNHIRMNLGKSGGKNVVFRDTKKGFERI